MNHVGPFRRLSPSLLFAGRWRHELALRVEDTIMTSAVGFRAQIIVDQGAGRRILAAGRMSTASDNRAASLWVC